MIHSSMSAAAVRMAFACFSARLDLAARVIGRKGQRIRSIFACCHVRYPIEKPVSWDTRPEPHVALKNDMNAINRANGQVVLDGGYEVAHHDQFALVRGAL